MLKLRRIEICNFVCFDDIVIEPSTSSDRPLTIVRAENESGKTTFLRAIKWCMYGEKGLPGESARFSLHPAWWRPDDAGIKTQTVIEFETDGSTRFNASGRSTTVYQLIRSVTTIGKPAARDDEPDFRRINEQNILMIKGSDETWAQHTSGVDTVIEQLLPWDLCDFFVMDADEAADFVGGSENKVLSHKETVDKTTSAVHSLLGIDIFKEASHRVEKIAREFGAQATKAIGDSDLDALQEELDQMRIEDSQLMDKISDQRIQIEELNDRLRQRNVDLESELKDIGAAEQLTTRREEYRRSYDRVAKQRKSTLSRLAGELESNDLLASLIGDFVYRAYETLRPLYESGHIPLKHINFVRHLLASGTCICGQDLSNGGVHRQHLEDSIAESAEQEKRADYLGQLHDAARSLRTQAAASDWEIRIRQLTSDLAELDNEASNLELEKRDIDEKLGSLDEEKVLLIRDEIATLETQLSKLRTRFITNETMLESSKSKIDSLEKRINQRQRKERAASDKRSAQDIAERVVRILAQAYGTIQAEQVAELSQRMNRLFAQMAANVSDDDFAEIHRDKATLRMIGEVGLRSVDGKLDDYEIYALNSRQRSMPPIEINGASRRVLALSFVLALCIESRTHAPLIADSLLNFMSGTVRRNTLRVTAKNSSQPILLLTGSDLAAPSEVETVNRFAGSTYTLTGQWHAIDAGEGGDVVNWTDQRQVSLACPCSPRQYCDICERAGQANSPGWEKRF